MRGRPGASAGVSRLGLLAEWVFLLVLWILFAGSVSTAELVVGAVAAGVGTGLWRMARATRLAAFRPHPRWLLTAWELPPVVAREAGLMVLALAQRLAGKAVDGRLYELPLDAPGRDPSSAAYRALVTAFTSLTPNTYVVDVDIERRVAIVHRLVATGRRPALRLPRWRR